MFYCICLEECGWTPRQISRQISRHLARRFALALSVVSADGSWWAKRLAEMGAKGEEWLRRWDASVYLPDAKCPFLFVSGEDDPFFRLEMLKKSAGLVKGPVSWDLRKTMVHSQEAGAAPESICAFADHWSFGKPLALPTTGTGAGK